MNRKLKIPDRIRGRFRFGTISFLFIIAYVNVFPFFFGPENSIAAVTFTILMSASMVRDLTATPVKHLLIQSLVLVWMALAAYLVHVLPPLAAFPLNFGTLMMILYAFTYEYSTHMYFPYILSYLFLIFISPIDSSQLPRRLLAMMAGAVSILLYQWVMGRNRVVETARDVLSEMTDGISEYISGILGDAEKLPDTAGIHFRLCSLSRLIYERRKKALCISEAGFSAVDAGRGLEHLLILLQELPPQLSPRDRALLLEIDGQLKSFHAFLHQEVSSLPDMDFDGPAGPFYKILRYTRDRLLHMSDPQNRSHYRPTFQSLKIRVQTALDLSPVRAAYAFRTALLLSCATLFVQALSLPHGKWLLFTLASVSLPYADDVPAKMKKRIIATIAGGLLSVVIYSLIPSPAGRTAAMMLSGYLSFYFTDYVETFTFSTIGAMGGAVFMGAFGLREVGAVFLIRLGYVLAGAAAAYAANCLVLPFSRKKATRQMWEKYKVFTDLLTKACHSGHADPQLYYNLVIQVHMLEEKLTQNAMLEQWTDVSSHLKTCQEQVRNAHRTFISERSDAPVFEPAHLSQ